MFDREEEIGQAYYSYLRAKMSASSGVTRGQIGSPGWLKTPELGPFRESEWRKTVKNHFDVIILGTHIFLIPKGKNGKMVKVGIITIVRSVHTRLDLLLDSREPNKAIIQTQIWDHTLAGLFGLTKKLFFPFFCIIKT